MGCSRSSALAPWGVSSSSTATSSRRFGGRGSRVAVALLLGATAFWVGRGGAPLCNPASSFQWHAVWHVLAALGMALYAYGAIEPHPAPSVSLQR